MLRRVLILLAVLLGLAFGLLGFRILDSGQFVSLEEVEAGVCRQVPGAVGAEDIVVHSSGVALISSLDRRTSGGEEPRHGIFFFDLNDPDAQPLLLTGSFEGPLRPHGLSLLEGHLGNDRLFVVNHPDGRHQIEIFSFSAASRTLVHEETVSGELLKSPNDLAAVGPRSFYVTNDHLSAPGLGRTLGDLFGRTRSNVVYFDGEEFRVVAEDIAYANGIGVTASRDEVFVAELLRGKVLHYLRDETDGALTPVGEIELAVAPDNITVDRHDKLWIAAHPKTLSFLRHARSAAALSPSQVLWVDPLLAFEPPVRTVYLNLGEELSGSSVGVAYGARLIVGSVFEEHFLVCDRGA